MDIYIKGTGNISPQNTFVKNGFLQDVMEYKNNFLSCIEPDYKEYVDANSSRRMGKIIKMGIAASMACLKEAAVAKPDAIITGTGLGCIQDTERFLSLLIENNEQMLTPTSFIQSTHNTISAQIALMIKCENYNFTYVHRGFSFESGLLDSILLLKEGSAKNVLLGGADETTPNTFKILQRLGHWKSQPVSNLNLLDTDTKGTISGEGASFFLLSNQYDEKCSAKINSVATIYKPSDFKEIETNILHFIKNASLQMKDIDLVLFGNNGDVNSDGIYDHLQKNTFKEGAFAYFKHLCGEYHTATSFALWLASEIIKNQTVPSVIKLNDFSGRPIKNILIYNHYQNINHSLMLVQKC